MTRSFVIGLIAFVLNGCDGMVDDVGTQQCASPLSADNLDGQQDGIITIADNLECPTLCRDESGELYVYDPSGAVKDCPDVDTGSTHDTDDDTDTDPPDDTDTGDTGSGSVDKTWCYDADQDGYGDEQDCVESDEQPSHYVDNAADCNDDPAANGAEDYPGAIEYCDGRDNDCDVDVDVDPIDGTKYWADNDGDGWADADNADVLACDVPVTVSDDGTEVPWVTSDYLGDCDDADAAYNPGADEACDDPTDYNCDGSTGYTDADGDATPACNDCDDTNADAFPGADEACDDADNDCDGSVDEEGGLTWYADLDDDGYGDDDSVVTECDEPRGYVAEGGDCNDDDPDATPESVWYADTDGDGYGLASSSTASCGQPAGTSAVSGDCNDANAAYSPAATEYCDDADNDCDGTTDEDDAADALTWYRDADSDGYGVSTSTTTACSQPSGYADNDDDCSDTVSAVNPGAIEYCDGRDNDCDGRTDTSDALDALELYADADSDGYGTGGASFSCTLLAGYVQEVDGDCDDSDADVNPGADEVCDSADTDEDCDGSADDSDSSVLESSMTTWYDEDNDNDGYIGSNAELACDAPSTNAISGDDESFDCEDNDNDDYPGSTVGDDCSSE